MDQQISESALHILSSEIVGSIVYLNSTHSCSLVNVIICLLAYSYSVKWQSLFSKHLQCPEDFSKIFSLFPLKIFSVIKFLHLDSDLTISWVVHKWRHGHMGKGVKEFVSPEMHDVIYGRPLMLELIFAWFNRERVYRQINMTLKRSKWTLLYAMHFGATNKPTSALLTHSVWSSWKNGDLNCPFIFFS